MLKQRIRALERKFAKQLAKIAAQELADEYVTECYRAKDKKKPFPDPLEFTVNAGKRFGYFRRTLTRAYNYLERCVRDNELPDYERLFRRIMPQPSPFPKLGVGTFEM